jgi:hypothetical protein
VTTPAQDPVFPEQVIVLLAVPEVARFHQIVNSPLPLAACSNAFVQVLPPASLSVTEGSVVASRLTVAKTRTSSARTALLMTNVYDVVLTPDDAVLVRTVIATV